MIALVACSKVKTNFPVLASVLYKGQLFQLCKRYCWLRYIDWRILSAKHGLLHPLTPGIEPYNKSLNDMNTEARRIWARGVNEQLAELNCDHWIVLAGKRYVEFLDLPGTVERPLAGLGYGQQVQKMKRLVDELLKSPSTSTGN